jgi:hypothetical protein
MITLKQFRRRPTSTDKRGIPMMISQGGHSIPPEDRMQQDPKGNPALISQGKHSDPKTAKKKPLKEAVFPNEYKDQWNPAYKFNVDKYYADPRIGTAAQFGLERETKRSPSDSAAYDTIRDRYKLDNHHLTNGTDISKDALWHYTEHHNTLANHYGSRKADLHPEIRRYTEDSSHLNSNLWNSFMKGQDPERYINDHDTHELDDALNSNKLPDRLTVYSGVKMNPGLYAGRNSYNRIYLPGYTSTSIDPGVAYNFSQGIRRGTESDAQYGDGSSDRHILRIHLPKDHPGEYVGSRSHFDSESEFLLPRQTSLQLMPDPTVTKYSNPYRGRLSTFHIHVWDAHPVKP